MVTLGNLTQSFSRPRRETRRRDSGSCATEAQAGRVENEFGEKELRTFLVSASRQAESILANDMGSTGLQGLDLGFHIPQGCGADWCQRLSSLDDRQLRAGHTEDGSEEVFTLEDGDIALTLRYENSAPTRSQTSNAIAVSTCKRPAGDPVALTGSVKQHSDGATGVDIRFKTTRSTDHVVEADIELWDLGSVGYQIDNLACAIAASFLHEAASTELFGVSPGGLLEIPFSNTQDVHVNVSGGEILLLARENRDRAVMVRRDGFFYARDE